MSNNKNQNKTHSVLQRSLNQAIVEITVNGSNAQNQLRIQNDNKTYNPKSGIELYVSSNVRTGAQGIFVSRSDIGWQFINLYVTQAQLEYSKQSTDKTVFNISSSTANVYSQTGVAKIHNQGCKVPVSLIPFLDLIGDSTYAGKIYRIKGGEQMAFTYTKVAYEIALRRCPIFQNSFSEMNYFIQNDMREICVHDSDRIAVENQIIGHHSRLFEDDNYRRVSISAQTVTQICRWVQQNQDDTFANFQNWFYNANFVPPIDGEQAWVVIQTADKFLSRILATFDLDQDIALDATWLADYWDNAIRFRVQGDRYLILTKNETKNYLNAMGRATEAMEQIPDGLNLLTESVTVLKKPVGSVCQLSFWEEDKSYTTFVLPGPEVKVTRYINWCGLYSVKDDYYWTRAEPPDTVIKHITFEELG